VLFTAALYVPRLGDAPLYVSHDEAVYALQAQSIAATAHDLSGRRLPMYIEYPARFGRPTWDQPLLIYAIAATLEVLPFSEATIRLPMAIAGILDVLLIYCIARLLFEPRFLAMLAAALLALTPAHFMHSRTAIDFQLSVPFVLGWLLALLLYLRDGQPRFLFLAACVLGAGVYGYVAAYLVTPMLAAVTAILLFRRQEAASRYGVLAAGLALPTVVCLPWMLQQPLPFRDILAHYFVLEGGAAARTGIVGLVTSFLSSPRLTEVPALYVSFFSPRFLFIDGPQRFRTIQLVGVVLLALAGCAAGGVRAAMRRSPGDLLILAGLLTAPIPASLAGEPQAIWRALHLTPFLVLCAIVALDWADDARTSRAAMVSAFPIVCLLGWSYHDAIPGAQAIVRAASAPLVVIGLASLFREAALDRPPLARVAPIVAVLLVLMHGAYLIVDRGEEIGIALLAGISLLAFVPSLTQRIGRSPIAVTAIASLAVAHLLYLYVDYLKAPTVAGVPVSLGILALRIVVALVASMAMLAIVRRLARVQTGQLPLGAAAAGLVIVQLAYFRIGGFGDYRVRATAVALVAIAAVGLAMAVRNSVQTRRMFGELAIGGLVGLAAIQFASFAADYHGDYRARNVDPEGSVRFAFDAALEQRRGRDVSAVYLGNVAPYGAAPLYWQFYAVKHRRGDLLPRTIMANEFDRERVRALPADSLVITRSTNDVDAAIAAMMRGGELRPADRLPGHDGAPPFWIVETTGR